MSDYDYYRGSSSYEDAVKNRLNALEVTGLANTRAIHKMDSRLRNDIQSNTAAIHDAEAGIRSDIRAATYALHDVGMGIRDDIQTNTNAIQDMGLGVISSIRESTYAVVASQAMLAQTFQHGFNAVNNTLEFGFGMVSNKLDAMTEQICSKLDKIHDIMNNPRLTESRELYRNALDSYKKGFYEEALEDCTGAVEKNKTDFISWYLLGHLYLFGAGKFSNVIDIDRAEEAFFNAAKYIDPDIGNSEEANTLGSEIYYYLGYARLIKSNDFLVENKQAESIQKLEEAEKASRESYRLSEGNLLALYEQAKELHFLERDDEALQLIEKLIRTDKNYALRATNDKNFESLWEQIEAVIKRLSDELSDEMLPVIEEFSNQIDKICSSQVMDWYFHFKVFRKQLPHGYEFKDKDYFTVREYYETTYSKFKSSFENEISTFFNVHDWGRYNHALKLYASGKDEDCIETLRGLIRFNAYFAIKATSDKKIESLWGDIEDAIEKTLKNELCQQIREKVDKAMAPYEKKLSTDFEFAHYPSPEPQYGKTVADFFHSQIEQFRSVYAEIEKKTYFDVRNVLEKELPEHLKFTLAFNHAIHEVESEIENRRQEKKQEKIRMRIEAEQKKQEEERRQQEEERRQIEESERKKQERETAIKNFLIFLFSALILSLIVFLEYAIADSNGNVGTGLFAFFIGGSVAAACSKNKVSTIAFVVCWAIATIIMFATGHPIVAIINLFDFFVLLGAKL